MVGVFVILKFILNLVVTVVLFVAVIMMNALNVLKMQNSHLMENIVNVKLDSILPTYNH